MLKSENMTYNYIFENLFLQKGRHQINLGTLAGRMLGLVNLIYVVRSKVGESRDFRIKALKNPLWQVNSYQLKRKIMMPYNFGIYLAAFKSRNGY